MSYKQTLTSFLKKFPFWVLGALVAVVILSNAWPGLGSAWASETVWSWLVAGPTARVFFGVTAVGIIVAAWFGERWLRAIVALPLLALALLPFDALTLEADLLISPRVLADHGAALEVQETWGVYVPWEEKVDEEIAELLPAVLAPIWERALAAWPAPVAFNATWAEGGAAWQAQKALLAEKQTLVAEITASQVRLEALKAELAKMSPTIDTCLVPFRGVDGRESGCAEPDFRTNPNYVAKADEVKSEEIRFAALKSRRVQNLVARDAAEFAADAARAAAKAQAFRHMLSFFVGIATVMAVLVLALFDKDGDQFFSPALVLTLIGIGAARFGVVPEALFAAVGPEAPPLTAGSALRAAGQLVGFLAVFLGARSLHVLAMHNRALEPAIFNRKILPVLGLTLLLWSPLGAAAYFSTWLSGWFENKFQDFSYNIEIGSEYGFAPTPCSDTPRLLFEEVCDVRSVESDIQASLSHWLDEGQRRTPEATATTEVAVNLTANNTAEMAAFLMDQNVPNWLAKRPHWGQGRGISDAFNHDESPKWYQFGKKIKKKVKARADGTYIRTRARALAWLDRKLAEMVAKTETGSELTEQVINAEVFAAIEAIRAPVRDQLWMLFRGWDVLRWIGALILWIAIVKSFGLVFGRVLHSRAWFRRMVLDEASSAETGEKNGAQVSVAWSGGPSFPIKERVDYKYLIWANQTGLSRDGWVVHQPWALAIRRLLPFRHLFQLGTGGGANSGASFNTTGGRSFVEITLQPGASAYFDVGGLYALSGNPHLSGVWNFKLENLMRGRIRHARATARNSAPSRIVLRLHGMPAPTGSATQVTPSQVIAWTARTRFLALGKTNWRGVLTGGAMFREVEGGPFVVDVGRGGITGAIVFLPALLLPI
ncbi:hypothetical protein [Leisingera daeponensis]|uniref:Uncharacterized protein n=1 Tax=Phaeobacter inhibens TaxID=221822 RepID=A0A2I7KGD5_9RHOB|nr:hypothetical protein [Leisingera daeponensis]AUR01658.1 hypothetical protein PhaeoP88_04346 [Phaeobacter inhibens]